MTLELAFAIALVGFIYSICITCMLACGIDKALLKIKILEQEVRKDERHSRYRDLCFLAYISDQKGLKGTAKWARDMIRRMDEQGM